MSGKDDSTVKRRRRWKRWAVLCALVAGVWWLDGPGVRWLGPLVARKALAKAGIEGEFRIEGRISGGLRLEGVDLRGGPLRWLRVERAVPDYRLGELWKGHLRGVEIVGLEAGIDLAAMPAKEEAPTKGEPPDLARLGKMLSEVRSKVIGTAVHANGVAVTVFDGEREVIELRPSGLRHDEGSNELVLDFGGLRYAADRAVPNQRIVLEWGEDGVGLTRFDAGSGLSVEDLVIRWRDGGKPEMNAVVAMDGARLEVQAADGGQVARLRQQGDAVVLEKLLEKFGVKLPVGAVVESLELRGARPNQSWLDWDGEVRVVVRDVAWQDWRAERVEVSLTKAGDKADGEWTVSALDGQVRGRVTGRWPNPGDWSSVTASGTIEVAGLPAVVESLRRRKVLGEKGGAFPDSALSAEWKATMNKGVVGMADVAWKLVPAAGVEATSLAGQAVWQPGKAIPAKVKIDGLTVDGSYAQETGEYQGKVVADGFASARIRPWLAALGVEIPEGVSATMSAEANGKVREGTHGGSFRIGRVAWQREGRETIEGSAAGDFAWPGRVSVESLTVAQGKQRVTARVKLADQMLEVGELAWFEGDTRLVQATAKLPVPAQEKWGDWKAWAAQEKMLEADVASERIDFAKLASWLPPDIKMPVAGSGEVKLKLRGSPADPRIEGVIGLTKVTVPASAEVPSTDVVLQWQTDKGRVKVDGEVRPTGYPTVTLRGGMAFRPRQWAEDPESLRKEPVEARVVVPRIDLARFAALVPQIKRIEGGVVADVAVAGTIGKPEWNGELRMDGGGFELADARVPRLEKGQARIRVAGTEVRIEKLACEAAGGTAEVTGTIGLTDLRQPVFAVRLRGTSMPVVRDDSMIVRADADLRLDGSMKQARVSGTVDVVDSLFHRDFELIPLNVPFTTPSRPSLPAMEVDEVASAKVATGPFAAWVLDVRVRTKDPFLIRGNLARGQATAELRVGGSIGAPQPVGKVVIEEASARLPFSELVVKSGTLTFTPGGGLVPVLDIRGRSMIGIHDVSLFFYGPLTSPKTALTSDPPLPENEIMTLLATGSTSAGLEGGNLAMIKAAQLLVEEWRRGRLPFGRQIGKVLDVVKGLDVRFGEDDPLSGRRVDSATLKLTDRWLLSGSVDREGETRGLLAFVMRFR